MKKRLIVLQDLYASKDVILALAVSECVLGTHSEGQSTYCMKYTSAVI